MTSRVKCFVWAVRVLGPWGATVLARPIQERAALPSALLNQPLVLPVVTLVLTRFRSGVGETPEAPKI
jgi:hypothetical protein